MSDDYQELAERIDQALTMVGGMLGSRKYLSKDDGTPQQQQQEGAPSFTLVPDDPLSNLDPSLLGIICSSCDPATKHNMSKCSRILRTAVSEQSMSIVELVIANPGDNFISTSVLAEDAISFTTGSTICGGMIAVTAIDGYPGAIGDQPTLTINYQNNFDDQVIVQVIKPSIFGQHKISVVEIGAVVQLNVFDVIALSRGIEKIFYGVLHSNGQKCGDLFLNSTLIEGAPIKGMCLL